MTEDGESTGQPRGRQLGLHEGDDGGGAAFHSRVQGIIVIC